MLFCLLEQLTKCLVREVSSFPDFYKTNSIITCHQIRLHCSVLLYSVWINFCSFCSVLLFFFFFFPSRIVSPVCRPFVRPSVCREIPKCSTDTRKVTVSKISELLSVNLRKKPTRGGTAGRQQKYIISPSNSGETNQHVLYFLTCAVTLAVFMFRLGVMGFVVCPCEHVSDFKCLCLLRAKIKGCFFLRNIIFLWIVLFSFVSQLLDF